jgi:hypothetical protein
METLTRQQLRFWLRKVEKGEEEIWQDAAKRMHGMIQSLSWGHETFQQRTEQRNEGATEHCCKKQQQQHALAS